MELGRSRERHAAVGMTEIRPPREDSAVSIEKVACSLVASMQFDLELDRIGLDQHEPSGLPVLGQRIGAAMQVEQKICRPVKLSQGRLAEAVDPTVRVQCVV